MKNRDESSVQRVLEEAVFILNEIRINKIKKLEETKLTPKQEKILEEIENDINACVTKLGLLLHAKEL